VFSAVIVPFLGADEAKLMESEVVVKVDILCPVVNWL
jgi:hypothetical protein